MDPSKTRERLKRLIHNDTRVNYAHRILRSVIEDSPTASDAALEILVGLAADPRASKDLIRVMQEPQNTEYNKHY